MYIKACQRCQRSNPMYVRDIRDGLNYIVYVMLFRDVEDITK